MITFPLGFASDTTSRGGGEYGSLQVTQSGNHFARTTDFPLVGALPSASCTVEAWVKLPNATGNNNVLSESANVFSCAINVYDPNFRLNSTTYSLGYHNKWMRDNQWHHYAFVFDDPNNLVLLYLDGQFRFDYPNSTAGTGLTTQYTDIIVGGSWTYSGSITGYITDVRIWDDIRTAQEIADNYRSRLVGNETDLLHYWKLFEDYANSVSGNSSLVAVNSPSFAEDHPYAVSLSSLNLSNETTQYLKITNAAQSGLNITGNLTIEAWVDLSKVDNDGSLGTIVSKGASGDLAYRFYLDYDVTGLEEISLEVSSDGTAITAYTGSLYCNGSPYAFDPGFWRHVAVTLDLSADEAKFYLDGRLIGTVTATIASINSSAGELRVGAYIDGDLDSITAYIHDLRIWNTVRTGEQIRTNRGSPISNPTSESNLQANWLLGDLADRSSNGNTLSKQGIILHNELEHDPLTVSTHSLTLVAASAQYAKITHASQTGLALTNAFTVEAWVKVTSSTATSYIIAKRSSSFNSTYALLYYGSSKTLRWRSKPSGGSEGDVVITLPSTFNVGQWHHFAIQRATSSSNIQFYLDGKYLSQHSLGYTTTMAQYTTDFVIGGDSTGASTFDGSIGEVRIWSTNRGDDISRYYANKLAGTETNLQGYWLFNNDYTDETSNGNDLTPVNSPTFSSTDNPY